MIPSADTTALPEPPEHDTRDELHSEPETIKIAGWTCVNTRLVATTAPDHTPSETSQKDDDGDEEMTTTASTKSDTDESRDCEWEGCDKTFTGFNAPTLLYLHLINDHVAKPQDTQSFDPKCHWKFCPYSGKARRLLLSHVMVHVPDYKPIICDGCDRAFQRESNLRVHKKTCKDS
ncbi:hypothetical protein KCU99_g4825, partial [Aureobasidium melanogenum]